MFAFFFNVDTVFFLLEIPAVGTPSSLRRLRGCAFVGGGRAPVTAPSHRLSLIVLRFV